jgi:hypothetical protein
LADARCLADPMSGPSVDAQAFGPGEWVLDRGAPEPPEPDPAPVTTIAWRLGHLHWSYAGRWGGPSVSGGSRWTCWSTSPLRRLGPERFWALMRRWRDSVAAMTSEQLDTSGFGQFPRSWDPEVPFITVVWWTNLEFIHHMAEIALLRDLWRARSTSPQ